VFWDFIPTLVIHKYYCSNQAGFWVYKTPEKWKLDNPNMRFLEYGESKANDFSMEITEIGGNKISFSTRATSGIQYTEILNPILPVIKNRRLDEILFDKRKNTVLAKKVTFQSGHVSGAPKEFSDYRFWVNYAQCDGKNGNANKNKWLDAFNQFMKFGE
jgi:hypothetical protein